MRTNGFGDFVQLGNIDRIIIFSTVLHIADRGRSSGLRIGRIQCGNGYTACVFRIVVNMFERYGFHARTRSDSYFTSQNSAVCTHIRERRIIIDGRQRADAQVCHRILQLTQINRVAGSIAFGNIGNLVAIHVQAALSGNFACEFRRINGIDADSRTALTQGNIFARFQRNG